MLLVFKYCVGFLPCFVTSHLYSHFSNAPIFYDISSMLLIECSPYLIQYCYSFGTMLVLNSRQVTSTSELLCISLWSLSDNLPVVRASHILSPLSTDLDQLMIRCFFDHGLSPTVRSLIHILIFKFDYSKIFRDECHRGIPVLISCNICSMPAPWCYEEAHGRETIFSTCTEQV